MAKLAVLIPSYNELNNIKKIVKYNYNFLVVDDHSSDGTNIFLKKKKINFLRNKENLGYEKSLIKGMKFLISKNVKAICTIDADIEHPIKKIDALYRYFKKNNLDILVCNRKSQNRFLEKILSLFFFKKFKLKDPMSGMKFYKTTALKKTINYSSSKYFLVDLIYIGIQKKLKIGNFEIKTKKNLYNSKIGNNFNIQLKIIKIFKFLFY